MSRSELVIVVGYSCVQTRNFTFKGMCSHVHHYWMHIGMCVQQGREKIKPLLRTASPTSPPLAPVLYFSMHIRVKVGFSLC